MSLESAVVQNMKIAMKAKDKVALETLRAIKSAILMAKTEAGAAEQLTEDQETKLVQKLMKQRTDAIQIYKEQGREDLAAEEEAQAKVLAQFLPEQLSDEDLKQAVGTIIQKIGANSMKDMGKVMGLASKELAGKADGKRISALVKELLS